MARLSNRVVAAAGAGLLVSAGALLPSMQGQELVKKHEGLRMAAYYDVAKVPTICYGSTRDVWIGQRASPQECDERLRRDLSVAGKAVARHVKRPISQRQYDALVSFTFNMGGGALASSTLLKRINAGDCHGAARQFDRWVYAGPPGAKVIYPGLVKRRADERALFEEDCKLW